MPSIAGTSQLPLRFHNGSAVGVRFERHQCGHVVLDTQDLFIIAFPLTTLFSQLPLQSSQRPPLRPPQLPLIARRPFMTPTLIPAMTSRITIKLIAIVTIIVFTFASDLQTAMLIFLLRHCHCEPENIPQYPIFRLTRGRLPDPEPVAPLPLHRQRR